MTNQFDSKGGEQNVGQGDHAIGKQVNILLRPVKMKTVVIAAVLAGGLLGGYVFLAPANNSISIQGNQSSGPTAIAQGTGATVNQTNYYGGVSQQHFEELRDKYAVTDSALASFFKIMEEQQVPPGDLDSKLREIAGQYKELLARVGDDQAAKQAIERGDYAKAEALLEDVANRHSLAAAGAYADNARLQRIQLRYAKAAAYWQKAAALLPEDKKKDRAYYLNEAGYALRRLARSVEAQPLFEQSLSLYREIGDRAGEGTTLSNIGALHHAKGEYGTALKYLEQSLVISREIGDRAVEGTTLNNISQIYDARGEYGTALKYLEQSLAISQEIGDKAGEGMTLNNISQIYDARGDYPTALKYLEQSLVISREISDRAGEAVTSWNIGIIYGEQDYLAKAEQHISRAVQLAEEIGHPKLKEWRKALEAVRAKLKAQQQLP